MSQSKKPRKAYRPRFVTAHTMGLASHLAAKPQAREVDHLIRDVTAAATALREGVASNYQWSVIAGSLDVANAIERQGVVRGLKEHLTAADIALQAIYKRASLDDGWRAPTLRYDELEAVREFVDLHAFQLKQLSRAEFMRAIQAAAGQILSNGGSVTFSRQSMEAQS